MPNHAPVVNEVFLNMREDGTFILNQAALLAYASDEDLDPLNISYIHSSQGELTDNLNGTWTFVPPPDFNGDLELLFGVTDGIATNEQSINLSVTPENDAPTVPEVTLGMAEDGTLLITKQMLLGNAYDIDGDILTVSNVSSTSGLIQYSGNDTWTFVPNADFNGSLDLEFTVNNGVTSVDQDLHVNVTAVNDAPMAQDVNLNMDEDGTITFSAADLLLAADASDIDQDILTIDNVTANDGTLVDNSNGTWSYTPDENHNGVVNLNFTITDGITTVTKDLLIDIANVNDAPTGENISMNMNEDGTFIFKATDLLVNAADIDGDSLSVSSISVNSSQGTIYNSGNGIYTFVPNVNFNGAADLSFDIYDGTTTITKTLTINVANVNDAPIVNTPNPISTNENTAITITSSQLLANASDIDGQILNVSAVTASNGNIIDNGNGSWTFTPHDYFSGVANVNFTVTDGITSVNQSMNVTVNNTITQHIHYAVNNQNTATPDYADSSTNYYINTPSSFPYLTTLLGSSMSTPGISTNVRINESFTNADNAYLSVAQGTVRNGYATSDTNGTVTMDKFINADVALGGTSSSSVTLTNVSRGSVLTGTGADTINITAKNTTDSYDNIFDLDTSSGNDTINLSGGTNTVFNVLAGAGADNVTLTSSYASSNINAGNGNDTITGGNSADVVDGGAGADILNTGAGNDTILGGVGNDTIDGGTGTGDKVVFSGDLNQYQFSYSATTTKYTFTDLLSGRDGVDNVKNVELFQFNDGTYTAANIQSIINAGGFNHAPIVAPPSAFTMNEDGSIQITQAALLSNATDADGNTLAVTSISVPSAQGSITGNSGGPWTFSPVANFNGVANLTFIVSDGTATATQAANVNVAAINDSPAASAISGLSVNEDSGLLITDAQLLAAGGIDLDGDNLSISNLTVPAAEGTVTNNGNGTWTFAPAHDFAGNATLTYTVSDGNLTASNTVTVSVTNENDAPELANISISVMEDHTLTINPNDILATVTDMDLDNLELVDIVANNGTLVGNIDGTWSYTPPANFHGVADLQYTISDGTVTRSKSLLVNVESVNDAPVINAFNLNMIENSAMIISAAEILSYVEDLDDANFNITDLNVDHGTLSYNDNNTWTYVPDQDYTGDVDLEITLNDGHDSVTQHANIAVDPLVDDLKFNVNNNLEISNSHYYNTDFNYTDNNGALISANYAVEDDAAIIMQQEDSSGNSSVTVSTDNSSDVTVTGFDEVNAQITGGDADLTVLYASRGSIYTNDGDDQIDITTSHNPDSSSIANGNLLNINTGAGNDNVHILGNDDNEVIAININAGNGNDNITLEGKYAHANIIGGEGDDIVTGGSGSDRFIFGAGQGDDTFNGGGGENWADSIMINSNSAISITQVNAHAWTLVVDGQEATLTTNVDGTVVGNHIDFAGHANGTLTLGDGSSVDFSNIEHVEW